MGCAMEGMAPMRGPMGPPPPPMMMQPPQMTEEMMMMGGGGMQDELSLIEQDLNMTRRPTRPVRFNADEFLSIDQLPPPKKTPAKPEPEPERPKPAAIRQVGIADQIAIRSYVLAKSAGKTGATGAQ